MIKRGVLTAVALLSLTISSCENPRTSVELVRTQTLAEEIGQLRFAYKLKYERAEVGEMSSTLRKHISSVQILPYRICSRNDYSEFRCVRYASIIAIFDDGFAESVVLKLQQILSSVGASSDDILILCSGSHWAKSDASSFVTLDQPQQAEQLKRACFLEDADQDHGGVTLAGASVLSGRVIDPLQGRFCGFSLADDSDPLGDMLEMVESIVDAMGKTCGYSIQSTLASNGSGTEDPPPEDPPPEDPPPEDPPEDPPPEDPPPEEDPPPDPHIEEGSGTNPNTGNFGYWIRDCIGSSCTPKFWRDANIVDCDPDLASCQQCDHAGRLIDECMRSAGNAPSCQEAMTKFNCCRDLPGDPHVLTPNPEGNLICSTATEEDLNIEMCDLQCSVASDVDCNRICRSRVASGQLEWNILDAVCIYAYWEDCYRPKGPSIPVTEPDPPKPLPLPYSEFLLGRPL